jgi:uncharacterized repeat protein (TIGR03803 family)
MSKLGCWRTICLVCIFCAAAAIGSSAQTFETLVSFDGTNGYLPTASPVQGPDGNLYGTTWGGTVFRITPGGKLTTIYTFCTQTGCPDGAAPNGLVLATDGNFYGTTQYGGITLDGGTVFKITPAGKLTTLYKFCSQSRCKDGAQPVAGLVQATNGNFYGTTEYGGGPMCNCGTFFEITPKGRFTALHVFEGDDGLRPNGLVQAADGNFYGTTVQGGNGNFCFGDCGTVFKVTPTGELTTLYSFCSQTNCADGSFPLAGLMQTPDGNLYGTTNAGGANSSCTPIEGTGCGTVFRITPADKLTTIYSFCVEMNCADGSGPVAGLIQATNGMLYGTTAVGGANSSCSGILGSGCGTVFRITPTGKLTSLYSFCSQPNCADGAAPEAGLVQGTGGRFYGTTYTGGADTADCTGGCGTVFRLSVGLGPFVETLPTSGKVGKAVIILGNNLKGSTSVTFNGTAANFTVVSSTEIKTSVPVGATTGFVKVKTPTKTLKSNVVFRVTK